MWTSAVGEASVIQINGTQGEVGVSAALVSEQAKARLNGILPAALFANPPAVCTTPTSAALQAVCTQHLSCDSTGRSHYSTVLQEVNASNETNNNGGVYVVSVGNVRQRSTWAAPHSGGLRSVCHFLSHVRLCTYVRPILMGLVLHCIPKVQPTARMYPATPPTATNATAEAVANIHKVAIDLNGEYNAHLAWWASFYSTGRGTPAPAPAPAPSSTRSTRSTRNTGSTSTRNGSSSRRDRQKRSTVDDQGSFVSVPADTRLEGFYHIQQAKAGATTRAVGAPLVDQTGPVKSSLTHAMHNGPPWMDILSRALMGCSTPHL